jgi:hypothetical protein
MFVLPLPCPASAGLFVADARGSSEDIANAVLDQAYDADETLSDDTKRFIAKKTKEKARREAGHRSPGHRLSDPR